MKEIDENDRMVAYLLQRGDIDERIADAMRIARRGLFVPVEYASQAYIDLPLPIGYDQTISAPSLVGFMTKTLRITDGMMVLEVGTGSGWQAALLNVLVGKNGHVYTIERMPKLVKMATENLSKAGLNNVTVIEGDGTLGLEERAPFDRIIVSAGSPQIPQPLIEQLKKGGRMLIPVGHQFWQDLTLVEKGEKGEVRRNAILPVMFVPLVGRFAHPERKEE